MEAKVVSGNAILMDDILEFLTDRVFRLLVDLFYGSHLRFLGGSIGAGGVCVGPVREKYHFDAFQQRNKVAVCLNHVRK
jgi:hypothetical protein